MHAGGVGDVGGGETVIVAVAVVGYYCDDLEVYLVAVLVAVVVEAHSSQQRYPHVSWAPLSSLCPVIVADALRNQRWQPTFRIRSLAAPAVGLVVVSWPAGGWWLLLVVSLPYLFVCSPDSRLYVYVCMYVCTCGGF